MFIYIYKLIKKGAVNNDMVYIGSTTDVKRRKIQHKYSCNKIKNRQNCAQPTRQLTPLHQCYAL